VRIFIRRRAAGSGKILAAAAAAAVFSVMLGVTAFAQVKTVGMVNDDYVNVRDGANTDSNVVFQLSSGDSVAIIGKDDTFYNISYEGVNTLFINEKYVDIKAANGLIAGDVVNVRDSASADGAVIGQVTSGELVTVSSVSGDWFGIDYNGSTGYIRQDFVTGGIIDSLRTPDPPPEPPAPPAKPASAGNSAGNSAKKPAPAQGQAASDMTPVSGDKYGVVNTSDGLNLRESPSQSAPVLTALPKGAAVDLIETGSQWHKVKYDGATGFVSANYLDVKTGTKPAEPAGGGGSLADSIISYGKQFIGTPYLWSGTNLNKGVDCSGFVYSVFRHFGISLDRTSGAMANDGPRVDKANLRKGDLVFFDTDQNGRVSHVGIYIGGGQFIQSSSSKRTWGVCISSLDEAYYTRVYKTACRVLP